VTVNDIAANKAEIDALVADLNKSHGDGTAIGIVADVTSPQEVRSMIRDATSKMGPLTVMVANAGIAHVAPALETTATEITTIMNVNFMGVWNCYTEAAQQMISQGPVPQGSTGYKILGAASIVAYKPFPLLAGYCASKWAVRGLTQVFAIEMAKHKIQVNAYAPGIVGTAMWELVDEKLGQIEGRPRGESVKKYVQDLTAMGRVSVPDDVAKVVGGFLCGPDSEFVTGQTLVVDGGIVFS
jgi:NAD(P)-dependent dehydrogenase (short-subunit alcohol dehydrogenase family)